MLAAKATINAMDSKAINSQNTVMRSFLIKNQNLKATSANGLEKEKYLELFHIHQARCKHSEKVFRSHQELDMGRKLMKTLQCMSEEGIVIKYGIAPSCL